MCLDTHLSRPRPCPALLSNRQQQWTRCAAATRSAGCKTDNHEYELVEERGVQFTPGAAFYRAESAQGRDLAVLAAAVYRKQHGQLRVLDVMAGSGMRGARYLQQAQADLVWCNDYDKRNHKALMYNLVSSLQHQQHHNGFPHSSSSSGGGSSSSSSSSQAGSSSTSGSSTECILAQAAQWSSEAEQLHYEGIRGHVLQWPSASRQQQQQQHQWQQQEQPRPQQLDLQHNQEQQEQQQEGNLLLQHSEQFREPLHEQQQQQQQEHQPGCTQQQQRQQCRVTHVEAKRLLASVYLQEDYFDLVDVDSFGSDTAYLPAAIDALKYGGMLYITSTDGISGGGKRPQRSLAAYGAYLRALPHANEQGLRMLIGAAVKEGAARGVALRPLFSLYSYHGPVFRVMLRATRSNEGMDLKQYGFVGHCFVHGDTRRVSWRGLSQAWCRCKPAAGQAQAGSAAPDTTAATGPAACAGTSPAQATPLALSGPMWTGPLHDTEFVEAMSQMAREWCWTGSAVPASSPYVVRHSKNNRQRPLESLLELLAAESQPQLPPWYVCIDTLALHLSTTPSRDRLIAALQARGFAACLCHVEHRALRTNATTQQVLQVAVEDCGYEYRQLQGGQHSGVPTALLQHHEILPDSGV